MSDSTPQKSCRYCAKDIPVSAALCSGCGRFQNWRRFFNFTSTILSLLVAFLSVMVVGLPQLLDALKPEHAQLAVTFRSNNDDRISLIVYNNGNVAGALEGIAELHVPTDYLPIEDPLISDLFNRLLPYNRIDLELALVGSENALIEAGASRHFELVALDIKPWHWLFDTTVTVKHELTIVGEHDPDELQETLDEMNYQPETITNVVRELVVTPLEPRVWQDADDQDECTLHLASIDVSGVHKNHELGISCRRVVELIALLPSRVRVDSTNRGGVETEFAPVLSIEHQLVMSGKPLDSSKVKFNVLTNSKIGTDEEELDDLFGDDSDIF